LFISTAVLLGRKTNRAVLLFLQGKKRWIFGEEFVIGLLSWAVV
jgi:hypothetical protein